MKEFLTSCVLETEEIGHKLASGLNNAVVAFFGDLGAGKTAFVRGMCKGIGYTGECSSPTFAIVHEYVGGSVPLYHFDMYRIESEDDLYSCGYYDYLDSGGILAVEWSENIEELLPEDCIRVRIIRGNSDDERIITIGERGEVI